jgi:hypothetical protein
MVLQNLIGYWRSCSIRVIFGFAAMPNRTGVRSGIHGVGDSGDSEKGSGGAELDFLDSVPICWGFYFENSSSAHTLFHDSGLYAC